MNIRKIIYEKNDNDNKGIEIMKRNQKETLELKNMIIELKIFIRGVQQRIQTGKGKNQQI